MKQHYKLIAIFLLAGIISVFIFGKCGSNRPEIPNSSIENDILKSVISDLNHDRDSLLTLTASKDTVWMKGAIRWREAKEQYKADSIPCDSLIVICDTLLTQDSSYIASLKGVIKLDSSIITNQKHLIENDSIYIEQLQQSVKKQKRQKRLAVAGLIGISVFSILK